MTTFLSSRAIYETVIRDAVPRTQRLLPHENPMSSQNLF
jgi:hypothetical protein